jgi:hypothetical protein
VVGIQCGLHGLLYLHVITMVALEGDIAIFNAILAPMCDGNFLATCGSVPHITNLGDDDEPIRKVMKRFHIDK